MIQDMVNDLTERPGVGTTARLTRREQFAMAAMQGLLAASATDMWMPADAARFAVKCADELIVELSK